MEIKIKLYALMSRAIEDGLLMGWNSAHKYGEPDMDTILDHQHTAIFSFLDEVIDFEASETKQVEGE